MTTLELCKILIVDDELLIRQGIKHYIDWEREGFLIVGEASNGQEALTIIEESNPHVIITDIVMPIMDGEELTRIVKEKYPNIEIIILSSFGEFEYVRSTFQNGVVDYILKPKLDAGSLLKALQTAVNRLPSLKPVDKQFHIDQSIGHILSKIVSGYEINIDSLDLSKTFLYSHYCLLGLDIRNHPLKGTEDLPALIEQKLQGEIKARLGEIIDYSFSPDSQTQVVLFNMKKGKQAEIEQFLQKFAGSEPGVSFVLSEEFTDFSQIGVHYKNSLLKLLNYRFYFPELAVITEKSLFKLRPKYEKFNLDGFIVEMKRRNFEEAFHYLQVHASILSKCFKSDIFEYKAFFGNIIFNITILLSNMDFEIKELDRAKYSYFRFIDEAQNADEVVRILDRFIMEAKKCITSHIGQAENINIKMIMEYISEHYAEPLTLTDVARYFHFNPSYLSSLFSNHNKEGFIEYLNKIRIEEATKLLAKGTATISEISSMVGFSDHSYFCKVFKKIKGLSPSQFKRKQNFA
jgi:two-component system, response regulator YesN